MPKYLVLAQQQVRLDEPPFDAVAQLYGPLAERLDRVVVHLAFPEGAHHRDSPHDVIIELSGPGFMNMARIGDDFALQGAWAYQVEEHVEKAEMDLPRGRSSPMLAWIAPLLAKQGADPATVRQRYDAHVPLALQVHCAMVRYVRHWTLASLTPGAADYVGLSILHFDSERDFVERHYATPAGRNAIVEDVETFLDLPVVRPLAARSYRLA